MDASLLNSSNTRGLPIRAKGRPGPKSPTSPYKGVSQYKRTGRWEAHIWEAAADSGVGKARQLHLGFFATAEQAARAHDRAVLVMRGPGAELNFPLESYDNDPVLAALRGKSKEEVILTIRRIQSEEENGIVSLSRAVNRNSAANAVNSLELTRNSAANALERMAAIAAQVQAEQEEQQRQLERAALVASALPPLEAASLMAAAANSAAAAAFPRFHQPQLPQLHQHQPQHLRRPAKRPSLAAESPSSSPFLPIAKHAKTSRTPSARSMPPQLPFLGNPTLPPLGWPASVGPSSNSPGSAGRMRKPHNWANLAARLLSTEEGQDGDASPSQALGNVARKDTGHSSSTHLAAGVPSADDHPSTSPRTSGGARFSSRPSLPPLSSTATAATHNPLSEAMALHLGLPHVSTRTKQSSGGGSSSVAELAAAVAAAAAAAAASAVTPAVGQSGPDATKLGDLLQGAAAVESSSAGSGGSASSAATAFADPDRSRSGQPGSAPGSGCEAGEALCSKDVLQMTAMQTLSKLMPFGVGDLSGKGLSGGNDMLKELSDIAMNAATAAANAAIAAADAARCEQQQQHQQQEAAAS